LLREVIIYSACFFYNPGHPGKHLFKIGFYPKAISGWKGNQGSVIGKTLPFIEREWGTGNIFKETM